MAQEVLTVQKNWQQAQFGSNSSFNYSHLDKRNKSGLQPFNYTFGESKLHDKYYIMSI